MSIFKNLRRFFFGFLLLKIITLQELHQKLKDKYKTADISTMQLFRVVRDNNITLKLTRIRHEPTIRFGKDIDINSKIKEFYNEVKKYKIEDIICIDETSIKSVTNYTTI